MSEPKICPYPGLRPFHENEAIYFKGREFHIEKSIEFLKKNKFLMLTGASGDGKSSMVFAGLIPNAHAGFFRGEFGQWEVIDFRPERNPLLNFSTCLAPAFHLTTDTVLTTLESGFSSLIDLYKHSVLFIDKEVDAYKNADEKNRKKLLNKASNLMIVIDQFEELFTNRENYFDGQLSNNAKILLNLIIETNRIASEKDIPIYIVCTMRSDYIGNCTVYKGMPELIGKSHYFIPRLNRNEIFQAIDEPSMLSGNKISPRLIERLLFDMKEGMDILPVLQHALFRICKVYFDSNDAEMDLIHYAKAGGMNRNELPQADQIKFDAWFTLQADFKKKLLAEPSLENVLNAHADELYETAHDHYNFSHPQQPIEKSLAQFIIRTSFKCVVRVDDNKAVRSRMSLDEITRIIGKQDITVNLVADILKLYAAEENSLIRPFKIPLNNSEADIESLIDITHEALIRNWKNLNTWIFKEQQSVEIFIDFKIQIERWKKSNQSSEFLLSVGQYSYYSEWFSRQNPNIYWIEKYLKQNDNVIHVNETNTLAEAETTKKNIENILQESVKQINNKKKLTKIAFAVISVLLMLSIFAFYRSNQQKNQIVIEQLKSKSNELAMRSLMNVENDATMSFRVAEQAYQISSTDLSKQALMNSYANGPFYNKFSGHSGIVNYAEFSKDGKMILSRSNDKTVKIWDLNGNCLETVKYDKTIVYSKFNPDASKVLFYAQDNFLNILDVNTQKVIKVKAYEANLNSAYFSYDGKYILSLCNDSIKLWNDNGNYIRSFQSKGITAKAIFSTDGKNILLQSKNNTCELRDLNFNKITDLKSVSISNSLPRFSSDSLYIFTNSENNGINIFDSKGKFLKTIQTGKIPIRMCTYIGKEQLLISNNDNLLQICNFDLNTTIDLCQLNTKLTFAAFSETSKLIAITYGHKFGIFNFDGKELYNFNTDNLAYSISFSPDGYSLVTAQNSSDIRLWNLTNQISKCIVHKDIIWSVESSGNGDLLLTSSHDNTAALWSKSGKLLTVLHDDNKLNFSTFINGDKNIITTNERGVNKFWDISGNLITKVLSSSGRKPLLTNDNNCIIISIQDSIGFFNLQGTFIKAFKDYGKLSGCSDISANGKYLAYGYDDGVSAIYSIDGNLIKLLKGHSEKVYSIQFSSDNKFIVTASNDATAKLWDITGNLITTLSGHSGSLMWIEFSPDNMLIASASQDQTAKIWDLQGNCIKTLSGFTAMVNVAHFSSDGKYLLTCSDDGNARLWDMDGNIINTYRGHNGGVQTAVFSKDEKYVYTGGNDGVLRIWPLLIEDVLRKVNQEKESGNVYQLTRQDKINIGISNK